MKYVPNKAKTDLQREIEFHLHLRYSQFKTIKLKLLKGWNMKGWNRVIFKSLTKSIY